MATVATYTRNKEICDSVRRIMKENFKDDPYKIWAKSEEELLAQYNRDYFGKYASGPLSQMTPQYVLTALLLDNQTKTMIGPLCRIVDRKRLTVRNNDATIYKLYKTVYSIPNPINFDGILRDVNSYLLAAEITRVMADNKFPSIEIAAFTTYVAENTGTLIEADAAMLDGMKMAFRSMDEARASLRHVTKQIDQGTITRPEVLQDYIKRTDWTIHVDAYSDVYFLIHQLGLQTRSPYREFVVSYPISKYNTFFPDIRRARRIAISGIEASNPIVGLSSL